MNLKSLKISTALIAMLAAAPAFASKVGGLDDQEPQTELKRTAKRGAPKQQQAPKTKSALNLSGHSGDGVFSEGEDDLRGHQFGSKGQRPLDLHQRIEANMSFLNQDTLDQPLQELDFRSFRKTSDKSSEKSAHIDDFSDDEGEGERDETRLEILKAQQNLKKTTKSHEDSVSSSSSDDEDYEGGFSPKSDGEEFDENEEEGYPHDRRDEDSVLNIEENETFQNIRGDLLDFAARQAGVKTQEEFDVFAEANSSIFEKAILKVLTKVKTSTASEHDDVVEITQKPKAPAKTVTAPKAKDTTAPVKPGSAPAKGGKTPAKPGSAPAKTVTVPVKPGSAPVKAAPAWTKTIVHARPNIASASPQVATQVFSALPVMSYALAPKHDTATVQQQFAAMSKTPDATKEALKKAYGKTATNEKVDQALVVGYILKKALNAGKANQSLIQIDGKKAFAGRFKADLTKAEEFSKMLATVTAYNVDHSFKTVEKSDKSVDLIIWNTHGKCAYATLNFKKVA